MNFRNFKIILLSIAIAFIFVFCGRQNDKVEEKTSETTETDTIISFDQGKEIIQSAFNALSTTLASAIQKEGIQYAIEYCSEKALPITDSVADLYNVNIKRISHQYRNPDNKASLDELELIEMYMELLENEQKLEAYIIENENNYLYYSPIIINNQFCLNCHGKPGIDIQEEDLIYINLLYPTDNAINFEMGQIRGLWRLEIPKKAL